MLLFYNLMFIELELIRFPIPFKSITIDERQLIQRIDGCRRSSTNVIEQFKLSDRETVIIFSYIITSLIDVYGTFKIEGKEQKIEGKKEEDSIRIVVYLCKSQERKRQLLKIADCVLKFIDQILMKERKRKQFRLDQDQFNQSKPTLKMLEGKPEQEKQCQELLKNNKVVRAMLKKLYIMPIKKFMEEKLKRKEEAFWKKCNQYGFQIESKDYFRNVDLLMIETNDFQSIIQELLTVNLFQLHLQRANAEYKKLDKYYHYRVDDSRKGKHNNKVSSKKQINFTKQASVVQLKIDSSKNIISETQKGERQLAYNKMIQQKLNEQVRLQAVRNQKETYWNIADYDRKFNELYNQKKSMLQNINTGGYSKNDSLIKDYLQCYYLLNLQTIGYLISFLIYQWSERGFDQKCQNSQTFLNYVYSKTFLKPFDLRKLRKIFQDFVEKNPPILCNKELSYCYIKQVLIFFEKLVVWHQIFIKNTNKEAAPQNYSQNTNLSLDRLMIFRQKTNKDSNLKLTTFDQRIFFDFISKNTKSFCIFQNLIYNFEYYEQVFKPQIVDLKFQYRSPKLMSQHCKYTLTGLIVSSTPNEQDLHIQSERQQGILKQLLQDKKQDKQHYSQIIRSYGVLIHDICQIVPDGVIVYFPSKEILRDCQLEWELKENIYDRINKTKKIFEESEEEIQNIKNVAQFKKLCHIGRGGIYFVSAHSQFSKYQTFFGMYSRSIVFLGVPYHLFHLQIQQKIKFLKLKDTFRFEQALKNVNRCLNNCINDPNQIKTVIFADISYNRTDIKKKWFPFIHQGLLNTLQVLDLISATNKKSSELTSKKKIFDEKRMRQQRDKKRENQLDLKRKQNSETKYGNN